MTELVGCIACGQRTGHIDGCQYEPKLTQVRLGSLRARAENLGRSKGLSLSAVLRLALSEWLERNGG
jgi:hypothetical protein